MSESENLEKHQLISQSEHEIPISSNINVFSAKLINQLSTSYYHKNFVFSPFSVYSMLNVVGRGDE